MSDGLYKLLKEGSSNEIPWEKAAEQFVMLKVSSGGILPEEVEELEKQAATLNEAAQMAKFRGVLSGVGSAAHADVTHAARVRRKRGERIGKTVGSAGGL